MCDSHGAICKCPPPSKYTRAATVFRATWSLSPVKYTNTSHRTVASSRALGQDAVSEWPRLKKCHCFSKTSPEDTNVERTVCHHTTLIRHEWKLSSSLTHTLKGNVIVGVILRFECINVWSALYSVRISCLTNLTILIPKPNVMRENMCTHLKKRKKR